MKDKNGTEWVEGKHKYSLFNGEGKTETYVVEIGGREVLIRFFDGEDGLYTTIYSQERAEKCLTFVEQPETVDDIRAEIDSLSSFSPFSEYCRKHDIDTQYGAAKIAVNHIIDRVVKAMEAEHE